jgi:hypothetical protein
MWLLGEKEKMVRVFQGTLLAGFDPAKLTDSHPMRRTDNSSRRPAGRMRLLPKKS